MSWKMQADVEHEPFPFKFAVSFIYSRRCSIAYMNWWVDSTFNGLYGANVWDFRNIWWILYLALAAYAAASDTVAFPPQLACALGEGLTWLQKSISHILYACLVRGVGGNTVYPGAYDCPRSPCQQHIALRQAYGVECQLGWRVRLAICADAAICCCSNLYQSSNVNFCSRPLAIDQLTDWLIIWLIH